MGSSGVSEDTIAALPRVSRRLLCSFVACVGIALVWSLISNGRVQDERPAWRPQPPHAPPTLVVYAFSASDPVHWHNLLYFLREGVKQDDGCEYAIVLQVETASQDLEAAQPPDLPPLPSNAKYHLHHNHCYDCEYTSQLSAWGPIRALCFFFVP